MDKKSTLLESKLARYSALATGAVAMSSAASSQVVYTDINPDAVVNGNGSTYDLDFNGDSNIDITFFVQNASGLTGTYAGLPYTFTYAIGGLVTPSAAPTAWVASSSDPANLAAGTVIDGSSIWSAGQGYLGGTYNAYLQGYGTFAGSYGQFTGVEGFVGVQFDISGQTHYGWARVEVSADGLTLTVKDYAFQGIPDGQIQAGQTVGIENMNLSDKVLINQGMDNVVIQNNSDFDNGTVEILSLAGQVILSENINGSRKDINTAELATGVYLVNVKFDEGIVTKKIYVR